MPPRFPYMPDSPRECRFVTYTNTDGKEVKLPWSSRQCVAVLDVKPGFESQAKHQSEI